MYHNVKGYIDEHHMLEERDKVIVGVSGGADSVCLLFMLVQLRDERRKMDSGVLEIVAVHVHHGLRGEGADADEQYVREICNQWEVPLVVYHENVRALAKDWNMSEEEAGRKARREAFLEVRAKQGGGKIALAHHKNDDAETVLFHLCRGTDIRGLGGIAPVSGFWIRPLLGTGRAEIESYLEKMGISYCTDETNAENVYARNQLRNQVIPCLEKINTQAVEHISRAAQSVREIWNYVDAQVEAAKEACLIREDGRFVIKKQAYDTIPEALKSYVVHRIICQVAEHEKDISAIHVQMVQKLLKQQVGRSVDLPYEVTAARTYEGVCLVRAGNDIQKEGACLIRTDDDIPEESSGLFRFRIFPRETGMDAFPEKTYTKWFDYDIIKNTVETRHRQPGDTLTINKDGGRQKLKKYFINEKISQQERNQIWLVADGHEIMWVVGYRQSQSYQVTEYTKNILEIQFCKGENYGRDSKSISERGRCR